MDEVKACFESLAEKGAVPRIEGGKNLKQKLKAFRKEESRARIEEDYEAWKKKVAYTRSCILVQCIFQRAENKEDKKNNTSQVREETGGRKRHDLKSSVTPNIP